MAETYRAFVADKAGDEVTTRIVARPLGDLPAGDLTIRVAWSDVNYKDGLATQPKSGVVRQYPLVLGIDLAGTVTESRDFRFKEGDEVIVTGFDTGVAHDGGYAEYARVPADWVLKRPEGLSLREAMAFGTAGFTAALAIRRMEENGLAPGNGPVLVTGATGGVGSMAVGMLANLGYEITGSTGKADQADYLKSIGAAAVMSREEVSAEAKPLGKTMWAGAIDQVGGATLSWVMSTMAYRGILACTGLTGGPKYTSTVLPLILRGVSVLGIDSVFCPMSERPALWQRMAGELKPKHLSDSIAHEVALDDLPAVLGEILKGKVRGRTLVRIG